MGIYDRDYYRDRSSSHINRSRLISLVVAVALITLLVLFVAYALK